MKAILPLAFLMPAMLGGSQAYADMAGRPEVAAFIREVSARRHLDAEQLGKLFSQVEIQPKILDNMARPAESRAWWEYRKLMVTEAHIQGGVKFWERNRASLEETQSRYGVAPEMVVAILGLETHYGQVPGSYRVIDALSTLAFDYPRRADYFRNELEEFLVLCKEEAIDPIQPRGSYAGAMGMPQFMPSSFRQYATDLDGDHRRNIWSNPADAIASVANYFSHSGWRKGEAVALPAKAQGEGFRPLLEGGTKPPNRSIAQLRSLGVEASAPVPDDTKARLIQLDTEAGPEYWLAFNNFYVITLYNHSTLYAMAAYQLGKEILARRGGL